MKTYEVYCENFMQIIQADSVELAVQKFTNEHPYEEIISVENCEFKELNNYLSDSDA